MSIRSWFPSRLHDYHLLFPTFMLRTANTMAGAALPLLLVSLSYTPAEIGWIVSLGGLSSVFMNLLGGFVSDRFTKKRLMLAGITGVAVFTALLGLARAWYQFVGLRLGQGFATGLFRPASQALAYDLNPRRRAQLVALLGSSYVLGNGLGPVMGGYVAEVFDLRLAMLAAGAAALLGSLYLIAACPSLPDLVRVRQPVRQHLGRLLRQRRRVLFVPLVVVMMDAWILNAWQIYLPVYLRLKLGLGYADIGLLVGLQSGFYVLSQPLAARILDRVGYRLPLAVSVSSHGICIACLPLLERPWWIALCLAVLGTTNSVAHPGSVLLTARLAPPQDRGSNLGLLSSASNLGQFLGPLASAGVVLLSGDETVALYALLVPAILGALAPLLRMPPLKEQPRRLRVGLPGARFDRHELSPMVRAEQARRLRLSRLEP